MIHTRQCTDCACFYDTEIPDQVTGGILTYLLNQRVCPDCRERRDQEFQEQDRRLREISLRQRKAEFWARSGVPPIYQDKTFDAFDQTFDGKRHLSVWEQAREWADGFNPRRATESSSLVLYSTGYGSGKTHLATAMLHRVIERLGPESQEMGNPVLFLTATDAMLRIRSARRPQFDGPHESERDVYDALTTVRLLCLDDVGKEKPSYDQEEVYYQVINGRYSQGLSVIITSNLPPNRLGEVMGMAALSRLQTMAAGNFLPMDGPDYRQVQAKRKVRGG